MGVAMMRLGLVTPKADQNFNAQQPRKVGFGEVGAVGISPPGSPPGLVKEKMGITSSVGWSGSTLLPVKLSFGTIADDGENGESVGARWIPGKVSVRFEHGDQSLPVEKDWTPASGSETEETNSA